jgi:hypothetical protein
VFTPGGEQRGEHSSSGKYFTPGAAKLCRAVLIPINLLEIWIFTNYGQNESVKSGPDLDADGLEFAMSTASHHVAAKLHYVTFQILGSSYNKKSCNAHVKVYQLVTNCSL